MGVLADVASANGWWVLGTFLSVVGTVAVAVVSARRTLRRDVQPRLDDESATLVMLATKVARLEAEVQALKDERDRTRAEADRKIAELKAELQRLRERNQWLETLGIETANHQRLAQNDPHQRGDTAEDDGSDK